MQPFPALLLGTALVACSAKGRDAASPSAGAALAAVAQAKSLPSEQFVSTTAGFNLTLPGIWQGRYRAEETGDAATGARLAVNFKFVPDSGSKAPSLTLMTVRIFSRAAWDKVTRHMATPLGSKIGEKGDDVFVLSLPGTNPYPPNSPEAPIFDRLLISISQGGQQVHLTPQ